MIIIVILVISIAIGAAIMLAENKARSYDGRDKAAWLSKHKVVQWIYHSDIADFATGMVVLATIALVIVLIIVGCMHSQWAKRMAEIELTETRAGIIHKIEQGLWGDRLDINDTLIVDEVTEFNKDIKKSKIAIQSWFIGVFISPAYLNVEQIELSDIVSSTPNVTSGNSTEGTK